MWMLFRRHRSRLLLVLPVLATVGYFMVKDDGFEQTEHNDPRKLPQSHHVDVMMQRLHSTTDTSDSKEDNITGADLSLQYNNAPDDAGYTEASPPAGWESRQESSPRTQSGDQPETHTDTADDSTARDELNTETAKEAEVRNDTAETKNRVRLLILAYMRTGSSMTGRILQYSPDIFYWYEPLHELERYYVTGGNLRSNYRNLTLNEQFKGSTIARDNISAALACDFEHVYKRTLQYYFMGYGTFGTRLLYPCFLNASTPAQWEDCFDRAARACHRDYKATAVKSIRLKMSRALEIVREDPKVKLLHLVRDPRAVLWSRHKLGYADFRRLKAEAELLCRKYMEDLDLVPRVGDPLRARYSLIRYEDVAAAPLEYTRHLFRLIGVRLTATTLNGIRSMTAFVRKVRVCPKCPPTPLNSSDVAQGWRRVMPLGNVQTISKNCGPALRRLGYRVDFRDEEQLRDVQHLTAVYPLPSV